MHELESRQVVSKILRVGEVGNDCLCIWSLFWNDENVLELDSSKHTKSIENLCFIRVTFMVCELYLNLKNLH